MTKKQAIDKLMAEHGASPKWEPFFRRIVDECCGDDDRVYSDTFEIIREKLNNLT